MTTLRADRVSVTYGTRTAVREVDLAVPPGQVLAVTGPSGAGKSSLLWALAGAQQPASGTVRLGDTVVRDRAHAVRLGIVLVPQGNGLARTLTAYENVLVPLLGGDRPAEEATERATQALALVGLEGSERHLVEELSGGQQQRVALARALASRAPVLLADEPTSDLDSGNRERMLGALRAEAARGAVVVVATHDPEAAQAADGELALDEGSATWARRLFAAGW